MDQRKVNMLAREYCDDIKRKLKPIILGHRMMPGLLEVRLGNAWELVAPSV
jgi:tyrosyl-tRNA synthetase